MIELSLKQYSIKEIGDIIDSDDKICLAFGLLDKVQRWSYIFGRICKKRQSVRFMASILALEVYVMWKSAHDQLGQLQENLVKSHACGIGDEVRPEIVRYMLLLKRF